MILILYYGLCPLWVMSFIIPSKKHQLSWGNYEEPNKNWISQSAAGVGGAMTIYGHKIRQLHLFNEF